MKVALYCRVSTSDQNCAAQLAELQEFCLRRGWSIVDRYVENASGARADRPELLRLMKDARVRRFDAVLVWKVDRFGRSVVDLNSQLQALKANGIRFLATSQSIDTGESSATANLLLNVLSAVSEFERDMISERVRSGMANARKAGKHVGRPRRLVDSVKVAELRKLGRSWPAIARELGIGQGTAYRAFSRRIIPEAVATVPNDTA